MTQIYTVIGLMSGTSLDGVDAAILRTDGETFVDTDQSFFRPYSDYERRFLTEIMRDALAWGFDGPAPNGFARAERLIDGAHKEAVFALLAQQDLVSADIDLIGYHGQTVLHRAAAPHKKGQTLQIGNGQVLAKATGIDVVYDFRSADVAAGGQGAPLAPVYHEALMRSFDLSKAAIINIGGVSNLTLKTGAGLIASDCGPGNGPLDSWIAKHGLGEYDEGGKISLSGTPDIACLQGWIKREFFTRALPKSADRYDFDVLPSMYGLNAENGAASLAMFTALGILDTLNKCQADVDTLIICGGGRHNKAILAGLSEVTAAKVLTSDDMGWDGDGLEAHAFAYLAVRHIKNLPLSFPGTTGVNKPMTGAVLAKANYSS